MIQESHGSFSTPYEYHGLMIFAFQSHWAQSLNCLLNRAMKSRRVKKDKQSVEPIGFIPLYQTRLHLHTVIWKPKVTLPLKFSFLCRCFEVSSYPELLQKNKDIICGFLFRKNGLVSYKFFVGRWTPPPSPSEICDVIYVDFFAIFNKEKSSIYSARVKENLIPRLAIFQFLDFVPQIMPLTFDKDKQFCFF